MFEFHINVHYKLSTTQDAFKNQLFRMTHAVYVSQALLLASSSQEKKGFDGGDRRHIICSPNYLYFTVIDFTRSVIYSFEII